LFAQAAQGGEREPRARGAVRATAEFAAVVREVLRNEGFAAEHRAVGEVAY
jgi:hypothetical protein